MLFAEDGGQLNLIGDNDSQDNSTLQLSGDTSYTARASNGTIAVSSGTNYSAVIQGEVTGQRYEAVNGGHISVGGKGPDFFPGTTAGSVETSTYSWYK